MTFSAYQHVMVEMLWIRILNLAETFGHLPDINVSQLNKLVHSEECYIPAEIHEYLKALGEYKDGAGELWRMNLPTIAIPHVQEDGMVGGHFGVPDADNHNVYECYPSPQITSRRIMAESEQMEEFQPLDDLVMPDDMVPTNNLLGWVPVLPVLHREAIETIANVSWAENGDASRIRHSPEIWALVQSGLQLVADKVDIRTGIPSTIAGSTGQSLFVETIDEPDACLRNMPVIIRSYQSATPQEIGRSFLLSLRRRRDLGSPGLCFNMEEKDDELGVNPPGWVDTINYNFMRREQFSVTEGVDNPVQDVQSFRLHCANDRLNAVFRWITDHFKKRR